MSDGQIILINKPYRWTSFDVVKKVRNLTKEKKVGGQRAYEHARKGTEVIIASREIEIKEFEITKLELPEVHFRIVCSKGTYIRSIANDFGKRLGCGAYLSALSRTRIGEYMIKD